ncbi:uncharacterized protein LOC115797056 [Archocentrus centrarchus]|uniref:uncharacterized protein LOC115797056 n=1 Tax=Archocentrus centrarchus TaxID=63155 RepID=UPI0011EA3BA1|nr:uncharacterized protein LOC115797056 [Archocentrus centrarchus]
MDVGHLHCLNCFFTHSVVLFLRVFLLVQAKLPEEIFGYLEDTITLPSGADPSWNLIKTEWSVFTNNTWIATYRKGKTRTERVFQYKGRLSLNTVTGDLTIHNLTLDDAMEYTVDLLNSEGEDQVNMIKLVVKQVKSLGEVFGYLGHTITLSSGADPSWNLTEVEWSVFTNKTWIATCHSGKTSTELVSQYKGRLNLNITSGDLMIHNLTLYDAMDYRVHLLSCDGVENMNKITLTVRQVKSLGEVFGYLGHTITLSSGADPLWNLTEVEWSVFTNKTWIATCHSGKTSTELVSQYKGRLNLNITSGDLMIHNLTLYDAMDYRVHLLSSDGVENMNKITLTVRQSSFSSVTLIVGLLIGILIILLLITLLFYSKLKDLCCDRWTSR